MTHEEPDNNLPLPEITAYENAKLGLEIGALEHETTPENELRMRLEAQGARLVPEYELPAKLKQLSRWLINKIS